jgi:DNA-binding MarR family transcriptional regulator
MIMLLKTARRISADRYGEKSKGVHMPHYAILAMLDEYGALSQKQISQMIDTDPGNIVGLIDNLEDANMVARKPDKHDRRRHALHITDTGRAELAELDVKTTELNNILFAPLTPAERRQFEGYLYRLLEQ